MIKEIKERGELFKSLDETEDELVRLVSSFNERQINMIPYTGSWTAAQVTEHITRKDIFISSGTFSDKLRQRNLSSRPGNSSRSCTYPLTAMLQGSMEK